MYVFITHSVDVCTYILINKVAYFERRSL